MISWLLVPQSRGDYGYVGNSLELGTAVIHSWAAAAAAAT